MSKELEKDFQQLYCISKILGFEKTADDCQRRKDPALSKEIISNIRRRSIHCVGKYCIASATWYGHVMTFICLETLWNPMNCKKAPELF